ncbi:hypothetical protein MSAN_00445700 [Mycena sanguinolenta]|uniref:Uncharacterized protein n=1 Tax=Mycena sanguinolenta TaxID=230812 RepID=A0A8H6ZE04_9AGAR|nr:hypothetical protein MSAN_00445700 [Mycena sanguinolenta]
MFGIGHTSASRTDTHSRRSCPVLLLPRISFSSNSLPPSVPAFPFFSFPVHPSFPHFSLLDDGSTQRTLCSRPTRVFRPPEYENYEDQENDQNYDENYENNTTLSTNFPGGGATAARARHNNIDSYD